jgi:hypothetical protein
VTSDYPSGLVSFPGTAEPSTDTKVTPLYTRDLPDAFFVKLGAVCDELECSPVDVLAVMQNESGIRPDAHNPNGDASGLIQFMPFVLKNLGWNYGDEAFRKLSAIDQLPFVRRYFAPHTGRLVNATAVYLATFLPALMDHAADPSYALAVKDGRLGWAYAPNVGFDANRDGTITVGELSIAIDRARKAPRYLEAAQRAVVVFA